MNDELERHLMKELLISKALSNAQFLGDTYHDLAEIVGDHLDDMERNELEILINDINADD